MKYGISWRSFVFPVKRFLGAFFCFLWNEMLLKLPTTPKKIKTRNQNKQAINPLVFQAMPERKHNFAIDVFSKT